MDPQRYNAQWGDTDGAARWRKVDDVVPDTVLHTDISTNTKRGEQGAAQMEQQKPSRAPGP